MTQLPWGSTTEGSHQGLLQLVENAISDGCEANVCVVAGKTGADGKSRHPFFAEVVLARPGDVAPINAEDLIELSILAQQLAGPEFFERLRNAMEGWSFLCGDQEIVEHGMEKIWRAMRSSIGPERRKYGWPFVLAAPAVFRGFPPVPNGLLRGPTSTRNYAGLREVLRHVTGQDPDADHRDMYLRRFNIRVLDYRGRIARTDVVSSTLRLFVEPPGVPSLQLLGRVHTEKGGTDIHAIAPTQVDVPYEQPQGAHFELKSNDETLDTWPPADDANSFQQYHQAARAKLAQEQAAAEQREKASSAAVGRSVPLHALDLRGHLGFLRDKRLVEIIERDLGELDACLTHGLAKATLLLAGGVLEGILLDVLKRNAALARSFMTKHQKWPDHASLPILIQIASEVELPGASDGIAHLLTDSAKELTTKITDHRDLIHPQAEIRGSITVDADTARFLAQLLRLVVRDLEAADRQGLLAAYERK